MPTYSQLPAPYHARLEDMALQTARGYECAVLSIVCADRWGYEDWHEPCTLGARRITCGEDPDRIWFGVWLKARCLLRSAKFDRN